MDTTKVKASDQYSIILLVNDRGKLEEDFPNPTDAQREFYEYLMAQVEKDPDIAFDMPNLDDMYDETEKMRASVFGD